MDRRRQFIFPVGQQPFAVPTGIPTMAPNLLIADNRTKLMRTRAILGQNSAPWSPGSDATGRLNVPVLADIATGGLFGRAPRGELFQVMLYVLLPVLAGIILSRVGIFIWMHRRAEKPPKAFSPLVASIMMGVLSYVLALFIYINTPGIHSAKSVVLRFVFTLILTWPLLVIMGPLLWLYFSFTLRGRRFLSTYSLYAIAVITIIIEYLYIYNFFNSS